MRDGLVTYDKRKGWRGTLTNKTDTKNWSDNLEKHNVENSLKWKIAIVKKISKFSVEIETKDKIKGLIEFQDISWTKKEFNELLKKGDVIYVKHIKENKYSLKQIPKINGGIVVMDPYTGRVLALSGGFSFKSSEFNRVSKSYFSKSLDQFFILVLLINGPRHPFLLSYATKPSLKLSVAIF